MRSTNRKSEKIRQNKFDPLLTEKKAFELSEKLKRLKEISRPRAAEEVKRLAELGDFSENAEYQLAKARLRGINNNILLLETQLNQAVIIKPQKTNTVQVGHLVTIEGKNGQKTYQILGSVETDPQKNIISRNSPLGAALLGRKVRDVIKIKLANKEVKYKILKITS